MVTLGEIACACRGKIVNSFPERLINNTTIDSRECNNTSLFIAISNKTIDNDCYTNNARAAGAIVLTEDKNISYPAVIADNAIQALREIALLYRQKNAGRVLAITGSVGKTTVKELCVSIIKKSEKLKLNHTKGNQNNTLGLPLTLMNSGKFDISVLEAGISEPKEMEILSNIARPDIAIITNIGKMHSEHLGSFENTALEKLKITSFMPDNGILLIPSDNDFLIRNAPKHLRILTVGEEKTADFIIENISSSKDGTVFSVKTREKNFSDIFVPIIGKHGALDGTFALAAATLLGISDYEIIQGLSSYTPCGDRQKIIKKDNLTVISDCYNAGPESMAAALNSFEQISIGQYSHNVTKILLLGDMLELGKYTEYEHFLVGKQCASLKPDLLIAYGKLSKIYIDGAISNGMSKAGCRFFKSNEENKLLMLLDTVKKSPALILIKGSRGMRLERFTSYLTQ